MATRLPRWIPTLAMLAIGGGLGWLVESAFTPDVEADLERSGHRGLPPADVIGRAWLPVSELEEQIRSLSPDDAQALFANLDPGFWCAHPNGRDALRMVVRRLAENYSPGELTRELFARVRSWDLPSGARAETLRNLTAALAKVSAVTPEMIGAALRGFPEDELRAVAAMLAEERRGESLEKDALALHQLLRAAGLKDDGLADMAAELAAAAWFLEQPEVAISFAKEKARNSHPAALRPLLRRLYALDPPAAVAALKILATNGRSSYWTGEFAFLAGVSAAEFRDVWAQVPKDERLNCLQGFAIALALQAPGNVLELARQFSAAEIYTERVHEDRYLYSGLLALLPHFAERDPDRCREWLNSLSAEHLRKTMEGAAASTPRGNAAFARFCLADPEFRLSPNSAYPVLSAIAGEDLAAALRELPRVPADKHLEMEAGLHGKAILDRFTGDIAGVLQALQQLPEKLRSQVRSGVYPSLALKHQAQLEQWIASNPDSPEAAAFQIYLADHDAFLPNAQREAFLARSLPTINEYPGVASVAETHVRFLAETDPPSAAKWFARIPDGERKEGIAQSLAERWAVTDMAAAVAWAEQLPPSRSRDGAFLELAAKQRSEPAEALQHIGQIANAELRSIAARSLVQEWALADHERASAIIAEMPLSEDEQRKLQAIVDASPTRIRSSHAAP